MKKQSEKIFPAVFLYFGKLFYDKSAVLKNHKTPSLKGMKYEKRTRKQK